MIKAVIFGGTSEGRKLCELCSDIDIPILYCTATCDGVHALKSLSSIKPHVGRLTADEMSELLMQSNAALVVDATHPYAHEASKNISDACNNANIRLLRVRREASIENSGIYFDDKKMLINWLEQETGNIFVTTGSSNAKEFARIKNFQERIWLRILPSTDSLRTCLELGYRAEQIICMQGPFTQEMNCLMFKEANARILVTKNSGTTGGFDEKVRAAKSLEMLIAVLSKPNEAEGISLEEACNRIRELRI